MIFVVITLAWIGGFCIGYVSAMKSRQPRQNECDNEDGCCDR